MVHGKRIVVILALIGACSGGGPRPDAAAPIDEPDTAAAPDRRDLSMPPPAQPDATVTAPVADAALVPDLSPDGALPADAVPAPLGPFPLASVQAARPELYAGVGSRVEGPSWRKGEIFFAADGVGLMRADAQGKVFRYFPTLNPVGSFTLADDSVLICEKKYILLQMFPDGRLAVLVGEGAGANFCNDVTVDADGNILFTDPRQGAIMRLTPAGALTKVVTGRSYTNGVEVDRENKYIYFSDTGVNQVFRVPLAGGAAESLGGMICDGMAIDQWGNLWFAQVTAGQAIVFDPIKRQVLARVNGGGQQMTNLVFGGAGNDTLFTTVVGKGIMRVNVGVRGFSHPGAARYAVKSMLDLEPVDSPAN